MNIISYLRVTGRRRKIILDVTLINDSCLVGTSKAAALNPGIREISFP